MNFIWVTDELGVEEGPRGTAAALGEGDVFMHSYNDHGTGGHWCAKIIFFSLLAVLVTLIGLIILENRGLSECKCFQTISNINIKCFWNQKQYTIILFVFNASYHD